MSSIDADPKNSAISKRQATAGSFRFAFGTLENISPDTLLKRPELVVALNAIGFPVSMSALETKVTRGNGPPYRKFGSRNLYRWGDALEWAQEQLSKKVRSASELRGE